MNEWRAFMKEYMPDAELSDGNYIVRLWRRQFGHAAVEAMRRRFLPRERHGAGQELCKATSRRPLLPGCVVSTSATNSHPIRQMHMQRWTGSRWELFGGIIEGAGS